MDGRYYGADEGDDPGELSLHVSPSASHAGPEPRLTTPIEMVARANGSPMILLTLKLERLPPFPYPFSILRSDGEPREPYEGIKGRWRGY